MKKIISIVVLALNFTGIYAQGTQVDRTNIKEDLNEIVSDITENYIYLPEKKVDLDCIRQYYENEIKNIRTEEQTVLFFEYLLDEFYDSHVTLNTNRKSSYRLFSPLYATLKNGKPIITDVWQTQIENLDENIIGAEVIKINGSDIEKIIEGFPTQCNDKNALKVREWIINKSLAGRYNQPRVLSLKLVTGKTIAFDLDKLKIKQNNELLSSRKVGDVGIIKINNALGNNAFIADFDEALDKLMDTKGLIIDLRNTVDGGNSYVARGIMGRFIDAQKPYQKHWTVEQYGANPEIERSWIEYVSPRKDQYKKPVVVLVGRWTGSMGEGLAIGFEGMGRAEIVGTVMERLAGEMNGFQFKHRNFSYRLSTTKLYHVNGTAREQYIPSNYVQQTTIDKDEILEVGINLIKGRNHL